MGLRGLVRLLLERCFSSLSRQARPLISGLINPSWSWTGGFFPHLRQLLHPRENPIHCFIIDAGLLRYEFPPRHCLCGGEFREIARRLKIVFRSLLRSASRVFVVVDAPFSVNMAKQTEWFKRMDGRRKRILTNLRKRRLDRVFSSSYGTQRVLFHVARNYPNVEIVRCCGEADLGIVSLACQLGQQRELGQVVVITNDSDVLVNRELLKYEHVHVFVNCSSMTFRKGFAVDSSRIIRPLIKKATRGKFSIWNRHPSILELLTDEQFFRREILSRILSASDFSTCFHGLRDAVLLAFSQVSMTGRTTEEYYADFIRNLELVSPEAVSVVHRVARSFFLPMNGSQLQSGVLQNLLTDSVDERRMVESVLQAYQEGLLFETAGCIVSRFQVVPHFAPASYFPYLFESWQQRCVQILLKRIDCSMPLAICYRRLCLYGTAEESEWTVSAMEDASLDTPSDRILSLRYVIYGVSPLKPLVESQDMSFHGAVENTTLETVLKLFCDWFSVSIEMLQSNYDHVEELKDFVEFLLMKDFSSTGTAQLSSPKDAGAHFETCRFSFFSGVEQLIWFVCLLHDACQVCQLTDLRDGVASILADFSGFAFLHEFLSWRTQRLQSHIVDSNDVHETTQL